MKDFDELLDGVLREDAAPEPRAGLEGRVMARVRADGQKRPVWKFVTWGAVAAALPVCIVALLVWPKDVPPRQQHVKEVPVISASVLPERVVVEPGRDQRRMVIQSRISVRRESKGAVGEAQSLPKLDVFPTLSVAAEPVRKLAEVSRRYPKTMLLGLAGSFAESKPPEELKIEPIEIARIEIAPLYPVKDTGAKEEQGR
jgi:hypothetical protein